MTVTHYLSRRLAVIVDGLFLIKLPNNKQDKEIVEGLRVVAQELYNFCVEREAEAEEEEKENLK